MADLVLVEEVAKPQKLFAAATAQVAFECPAESFIEISCCQIRRRHELELVDATGASEFDASRHQCATNALALDSGIDEHVRDLTHDGLVLVAG